MLFFQKNQYFHEKLVFGLSSLIFVTLLGQMRENMQNTLNLNGTICWFESHFQHCGDNQGRCVYYGCISVGCKKTRLFCLIFRNVFSLHHQRRMTRKETENHKKRRERGRAKEAQREKQMPQGKGTQSRVGPPSSIRIVHTMEDWVPHSCLNVGSHVFIQTVPGSAVVTTDF